jgi:hypothetical protein
MDERLPPPTNPKQICFLKSLYSNRGPVGNYVYASYWPYGSSHFRKIMEDKGESTLELDRLVFDSADIRRNAIINLLKRDNILNNSSITERIATSSFLLNIWISAETFEKCRSFIMKNNITFDEEDIRDFLKFVLDNDDFLANWGHLPGILNMKGTEGIEEHQDQELSNYMQIKKKEWWSKLPPSEYPKSIIRTDDPYIKIIKKDTLLFRGYKNYRGYADQYRSFAWVGLEYTKSQLWNYAIPPDREDNPKYLRLLPVEENSQSFDFDFLFDYCQSVGGIAVFRVKKDLEVLDFSNIVTLRYITNYMKELNAPDKVVKAFASNWKQRDSDSNPDIPAFQRFSVDVTDEYVADWLCDNGIGGYVSIGVSGLHDEALICDFHDKTEYVGTYELSDVVQFHMCEFPYNQVNLYLNYW